MNWRSTLPVLQPDSFSAEERRPVRNSAPLWQTFIGLFHCRRLRELEKDITAEREARMTLQGQVVSQRGEIDRMAEMLAEALKNERRVYQMQVNVNMQTRYGMIPFPDAPAIPNDIYASKMPTQIEPDYVNARTLVAQAQEKFHERGRELREKAMKGQS